MKVYYAVGSEQSETREVTSQDHLVETIYEFNAAIHNDIGVIVILASRHEYASILDALVPMPLPPSLHTENLKRWADDIATEAYLDENGSLWLRDIYEFRDGRVFRTTEEATW
jgi:hypothetical protein